MGKLFARIYRTTLICLMTTVASGVFTIIPTVEAEAAPVLPPCQSWVKVVDVSSNNIHPINWKALVKARVAGAYVKNSENVNYVNPFWKNDTAQAQKVGIPYGGYYFAQPGLADPISSARFFVKNGGTKGQLPPALDLEVTKLKPYDTAVWSVKWLQEVQRLSGRKPIIYVGYYFPASQFQILKDWDLWLPAYPNGYKPAPNACVLPRPKIPNPWASTGWQLWQFTSSATFAGVAGRQDLSVSLPAWFNKWTGAGIQPNKNPNKPASPLYSYESHGTKVKQIQTLLISKGLLPKGADDGIFGIQTKTAVRAWQTKIGVTADGMWSDVTQKASDYFIKNGRTLAHDTKLKSLADAMPDWKFNVK